jgi:hypothetical protein
VLGSELSPQSSESKSLFTNLFKKDEKLDPRLPWFVLTALDKIANKELAPWQIAKM